MFSYYGSKSKIAHLYPPPKHNLIIEPFAGSARYSLLHWRNEVLLYDLSKYVYKVWDYLINHASKSDILALPDVPSGINVNWYEGLTQAERWLIGYNLCAGKAVPRKVGHAQNRWAKDKIRIADNLHKIKHWSISQAGYSSIKNEEATWFIDPPYQMTQLREGNVDRYPHWQIDYRHLASWCRERLGQAIVCEGDGAYWLPFDLLKEVNANTNGRISKKNGEFIWTGGIQNENHSR